MIATNAASSANVWPQFAWLVCFVYVFTFSGSAISGPLWITDTEGVLFQFDGLTGAFTSSTTAVGIDNPLGVTIGPDRNVYLANNNSNRNILAFSGDTGAFLAQFTFDPALSNEALFDLAFGPDQNLYIAVPTSDLIRRYSGASGAFLENFATVTGGPVGLAFGPDFHLYVSTANSSEVVKLDGNTGSVLSTMSAANLERAAGLAFGPDGSLYVASQLTDVVLRFDTNSGVSSVFTVGGKLDAPNGVAFGPDGNLYVTSLTTGSVLRYNGDTGIFQDVFIEPHAGGLNQPAHLAFARAPLPMPEPSTIALLISSAILISRKGVLSFENWRKTLSKRWKKSLV